MCFTQPAALECHWHFIIPKWSVKWKHKKQSSIIPTEIFGFEQSLNVILRNIIPLDNQHITEIRKVRKTRHQNPELGPKPGEIKK
jgi:hypothetical protein